MDNGVAERVVDLAERIDGLYRKILKFRYLMSRRIPWTKGYSEYKYDFIGEFINSEQLSVFNAGKLPSGYGYRLDERCVEYPWFFSRLKEDETRLLDAGSVLNFRQILSADRLKHRKLYISTLFYEGHVRVTPCPSYVYEDLREMSFRDGSFDAVCSLSTVEHIGLDNTLLYTPDQSKRENDKYSYLKAIREFRRVLKKGGTLYLSVPFGRYKNHGWLQVFDAGMVERLVEAFAPAQVSRTFFKYEHDQWNFSDEESCREGYCFDIRAAQQHEPDYLAFSRSVLCLEMTA